MNSWLIARLRFQQFFRLAGDGLADNPSLSIVPLLAASAILLVQVSLYRTFISAPEEILLEWLSIPIRLTLIAAGLGSLRITRRDLTLQGISPSVPVSDGAMVFGMMVPLLGLIGLMSLLVLAPIVLALASRDLVPPYAIAVGLVGAPILTMSASWMVVLCRLWSSRWRIPVGLAIGASIWTLVDTDWLNIFLGGERAIVGLATLITLSAVACRWLITSFHSSADGIAHSHLPPVGYRWEFPQRLPWMHLEARLVLRDNNLLWYNLWVILILWALLVTARWAPGLLQADRGAHSLTWSRYVIPFMYAAVMLVAYGPLRARSRDLPTEQWLCSLPLPVPDYLFGKAVVHIAIGTAFWLAFVIGLLAIIGSDLAEWGHSLTMASMFSVVTHSMAFFWGCAFPFEEEGSLPSVFSAGLFYLASIGLFHLADRLEVITGSLGVASNATVMVLVFLGLATALEERRRSRAS